MLKLSRWIFYSVIALTMSLPTLFMFVQAVGVDPALWQDVLVRRVPRLGFNSVLLVVTVTASSLVIGGGLAYLVERTDLPGRAWLRPLLVSPLIIPCYIIAICYINFFGMHGIGEKLFHTAGFAGVSLPNLYGFWGAAFVLTMGAFPYVYMIVRSSLSKLDPTFSEAAGTLGAGLWRRLTSVAIPLLLPALSAGGLLVALYVLSDFGVVSLLRFPTFVSVIYDQMSGRYDYATATALSMLLLIMTMLIFVFKELLVSRRVFVSVKNKTCQRPLIHLKWMRWLVWMGVMWILVFSLILPLGVLLYWFGQSFSVAAELQVWTTTGGELLASSINSLGLATMVATIGVILAIPMASLQVRQSANPWAAILNWLAQSGVAMPGVLIALGVSLIFRVLAPQWNFSILALAAAFLVHFFAQGLQMSGSGIAQVSRRLEEAGRLLGRSSVQVFCTVTGPMMRPALLTAWTLIFLSSMRELPASLLLRPAGFDPLTVKVWLAASEGFYEQAAGPALLIVVLSLPLVIIMNYYQDRINTWE